MMEYLAKGVIVLLCVRYQLYFLHIKRITKIFIIYIIFKTSIMKTRLIYVVKYLNFNRKGFYNCRKIVTDRFHSILELISTL